MNEDGATHVIKTQMSLSCFGKCSEPLAVLFPMGAKWNHSIDQLREGSEAGLNILSEARGEAPIYLGKRRGEGRSG